MKCWICGDNNATSHEHRIKKSDLRSQVNSLNQKNPLHYAESKKIQDKTTIKKKKVGSLNANILKYKHTICHCCNTTRTQQHDQAWETFSKKLQALIPTLLTLRTDSCSLGKIA